MAGLFLSLAQPDSIPRRERLPRHRTGPAWLWALRSAGRGGRVFARECGRRCGRHSRRARNRNSGHRRSRLGSRGGMVDGYGAPESHSQACGSFGGKPLAPRTLRQREMGWYQLLFQFEGIAEGSLQHDNWALFQELLRGNGDIDRYIADLSRPDALRASLNWYRANLAPRPTEPPPTLPPVEAPTLG